MCKNDIQKTERSTSGWCHQTTGESSKIISTRPLVLKTTISSSTDTWSMSMAALPGFHLGISNLLSQSNSRSTPSCIPGVNKWSTTHPVFQMRTRWPSWTSPSSSHPHPQICSFCPIRQPPLYACSTPATVATLLGSLLLHSSPIQFSETSL